MEDYKIVLGALLDSSAKGDIDDQLKAIKDLSVIVSKATLSDDAISEIKKQLTQNGIDLKLVFGNTNQVINQAKQTGQQIGQQIQNGINAAIQKGNLQAKDIKLSVGDNGDVTAKIEVIRNNFTKLGLSATEVQSKMQGVDSELQTLKTLMNSGADDSAIITQFDKLKLSLTQTQNDLKITRSEYGLLATEQQRLALANTIEAWNQKNTAATKEARANNELYIQSLRDLNTEMTRMQVGKTQTGFKQIENSMRGLNKLGASLKDQFKQAYSSFTMWLSASTAVMKVISETKEAVTELKEIDTLLTEISKANDSLTDSQLADIGDNSFDVSSKYGKTATDYLSGVQEASRAGYENAEGIAELSTAIQGAGDMTDELANSYIIATDKAFKMNGSIALLTETLDGANNITNHNAVNMTELAEGMSVVGSQAASSQMSVEETTAAIGTLVAVTQQSGSEMGNAFKGILMNLRQVTGEVEDGGDAIDEESLTKYEEACNKLGVSLSTVKDGVVSLKEPMQILKELSEEYTKLDESDATRADLLNSVGGKYRANALNAILENYDMYEKMLQDYSDGTGSMAREAEKTAQSWEGSLNRLSNTWTDTVENIADSDAIVTTINSLNDLLSFVNELTSSLGSVGTIGLGAGLFAGIKNVGRDKMFSLMF